jgi:hypothetical protein
MPRPAPPRPAAPRPLQLALLATLTSAGCVLPRSDGAESDADLGPDAASAADDTVPAGDSAPGRATDAAGAADGLAERCFCSPHQVCVEGYCEPKPCALAAECNPASGAGPDETVFYCPDGKCRAWQCGKDDHCAAGEKCNTLTSKCYQPRTGCQHDGQCVDDDACTSDLCDKATGACQHAAIAGCCASDADCAGGPPCTTGVCQAGTCKWSGVAGCCAGDSDCDDGDPCTADACTAKGCAWTPAPGCCSADAQCDDDDPATADSCALGAKACVHALPGAPASCAAVADCQLGACASASCVGGACSYGPSGAPGCCAVAALDCPLGSGCAAPSCAAWSCGTVTVKGGALGPHQGWDFEAGLGGWTVEQGNALAGFHQATGWAGRGQGALRYGVPGKLGWAGGFPNKGAALSPLFTAPGAGAVVSALVFFDGEPSAGVHQFGLEVVAAGKTTSLWSKNVDLKGNTAGAWKQLQASLAPWAGQQVRLRWWFDVAVAYPKEGGKGLYLDAVRVEGACP